MTDTTAKTDTAAPTTASATATATEPAPGPAMARIVITVDHVYVPFDADGNPVAVDPVSNVSTSKVLRDAELTVPDELALFLVGRKQARLL